jgi:proteasome activator subunit 4
VKDKKKIIDLLALLINKTKSERGYSGAGRLLARVLHTLAGVYPLNGRFVNTDEWEDPGKLLHAQPMFSLKLCLDFEKDHNVHWGRLYEAQDVKIEWHGEEK